MIYTIKLPIQSRSSYADLISFQYCPFLNNIKQLFSKSCTLPLFIFEVFNSIVEIFCFCAQGNIFSNFPLVGQAGVIFTCFLFQSFHSILKFLTFSLVNCSSFSFNFEEESFTSFWLFCNTLICNRNNFFQ